LGRPQYEYIKELAAAGGRAIAKDQEALADIVLKVWGGEGESDGMETWA
jgi:hypothetical protein